MSTDEASGKMIRPQTTCTPSCPYEIRASYFPTRREPCGTSRYRPVAVSNTLELMSALMSPGSGNRAFGDFQGLVGAEGNLSLVFLRIHSPAFPPPFPSRCPFPPQALEELLLGLLHCFRRSGVRLPPRALLQLRHRNTLFEVPGQVRQLAQNLPRRRVPAIHSLFFTFRVDFPLRHPARPMKVQIRIEILFVERLDRRRMPRGNVVV